MNLKYYKNLDVDIYIPEKNNFKTIVYFHGGGLVEGSRSQDNVVEICKRLKSIGFCVFNFDYSLYPDAKFPSFLIEAAKAVKFAILKSKELGGNGEIFVSGSSAGAYLTTMLFANKKYLLDEGVDPLTITGWMPESGQMTDHFHVIQFEDGLDPDTEIITEKAPLFFLNDEFRSSPIHIIVYDDDMKNRLKQNVEFFERLKKIGHTIVSMSILKGTHCEGSSHPDNTGEFPYIKELTSFISSLEK